MRLGILVSHPIQYHAPFFRELARHCDLHVFFAHRASPSEQAKAGFGVAFNWDTDLLSGYAHTFLKNTAQRPTIHRFSGCDTPEIERLIAAEAWDAFVVYGWHLKCYWQAVSGCRKKAIPVLARTDSQLERGWTLKSIIKMFLYPCFAKYFNGYLAAGTRSMEYLLRYRVSPCKIFVVPHCVDVDWFSLKARNDQRNRDAFRLSYGFSADVKLALFVGKLISKKNPMDILRAIEILVKQGRNIGCIIVGAGPLEVPMKQMAAAKNLPCKFAGFKNQSELPDFYAHCDSLVLPSDRGETWGLVVNEAFACGLPAVVSSDAGCSPDLIIHQKTGIVYPAGDISALAAAINEVLQDDNHLMAKPFINDMNIKNSIPRSVNAILSAVEEVIRMDQA